MRLSRVVAESHGNIVAVIALGGIAMIFGCGDGKITRYPVTGSVLVDGQTVEGVQIVFIPIEGSEEFLRERPAGYTGPDGKFELTTFGTNDGAPAGDYKVMIRWFPPNPQSAPATRDDRQRAAAVPDRLGGRYANPDETGLTATVPKGGGEIPPFEVQTR
jgi:hypothetical protein